MSRSVLSLFFVAVCLIGCNGFDEIDYSRLPGRASWQHPEEVIRSLGLKPGDHVADVGAGEG
jgi:cyclopropane fatty-acyl-phospholipid synthase-like methyltransferase